MNWQRLMIGGMISLAGLFSSFFLVLPLAMIVMATHFPFPGASLRTGTPVFPLSYALPMMRLNLFWGALAWGVSVALAVYIAPKGETRRYAWLPLFFYALFFLMLLAESLWLPLMPLPAGAKFPAGMFRPLDFVLAIVGGIIFAWLGGRVGGSLRGRPGSPGARLLETLRHLEIGRGWNGRPIRLNL